VNAPLAEVRGLSVDYLGDHGRLHALRNVDLDIPEQGVLGIVGESGCGKSTLAAALGGLLPDAARVVAGEVRFRGFDLLGLSSRELREIRGRDIATVFQDPMTTFNPVKRIGQQIADYLHHRRDLVGADRRRAIIEMFRHVGIADPESRVDGFPHEFSGGMRQRMSVATALLAQPRLLIADEPTTALDVTMEAQIIHLLRELSREFSGAIVIISHQLGVIAELCDRVAVMYAGEIVEQASVDALFHAPRHPYTRALLACDPAAIPGRVEWLPTVEGEVPNLLELPAGCAFAPRCPSAMDVCRREWPPVVRSGEGQAARCHLEADADAA